MYDFDTFEATDASTTAESFGCLGVDWVKLFPSGGKHYKIRNARDIWTVAASKDGDVP